MVQITGKTKLTAIIGQNIGYSLSPALHNYWYDLLRLDRAYVPIEATPENFDFIVKGLFASGFLGMNVTVPFKEKAYKIADILSLEAQKAKAVNVLYQKDGAIHGHNTDGIGLINAIYSIKPNFSFETANCLILGAGGAASGIIASLLEKKIKSISILNRSFDKAQELCNSFSTHNIEAIHSYENIGSFDLVIQTTSLKKIEPHSILDFPVSILNKESVVIDINYGFSPNEFLKRASTLTPYYTDGLEMLIEQARPSFSLFNNTPLPINDDKLKDYLKFTI